MSHERLGPVCSIEKALIPDVGIYPVGMLPLRARHFAQWVCCYYNFLGTLTNDFQDPHATTWCPPIELRSKASNPRRKFAHGVRGGTIVSTWRT